MSSTIPHTDLEPSIPSTSVLVQEKIVPGLRTDWFTRLISPLTNDNHQSVAAASPMVTPLQQGGQFTAQPSPPPRDDQEGISTMLLIFIPILVVLFTVLVGMTVFLAAMLYMRRKKGIRLLEDGGPLDLSKGDGIIGEGGVDGVESRWLESVEPDMRDAYKRAKDYQLQYPPSSVPSEITLSQFLSIQEKGVSAWSFEPDYEDNLSLYVQSRTEITFLADGPGMPTREGGGNSVMANLPLPKLNEVYYWEVKVYEKPVNTEISIGLATKPYPSFRLPGWNKHSVAYFASDGFKSHDYPFTASSYGPPLAEGDVLGVGYRPRTGTVFFTRNGKKLDDAYTGLQRLNLFPIVGANGACTLHINLGQAGFVFIEANVKKWGLAPMVGTLAPPPAYGSERGSILLDAGYGTPSAGQGVGQLLENARNAALGSSIGSSSYSLGQGRPIPSLPSPRPPSRISTSSSRRHRRAGKSANLVGSVPIVPSPLRGTGSEPGPGPTTAGSRRRALGRGDYISPTDTPRNETRVPAEDTLEYVNSNSESEEESVYGSAPSTAGASSPVEHNPPTPNLLDISLHSLRGGVNHYFGGRGRRTSTSVENGNQERDRGSGSGSGSGESDETARPTEPSPPPPGYAPLDPHMYSGGLPADLPEELINQAIASMSEPLASSAEPESPTPRRTSGWLPFGRRS